MICSDASCCRRPLTCFQANKIGEYMIMLQGGGKMRKDSDSADSSDSMSLTSRPVKSTRVFRNHMSASTLGRPVDNALIGILQDVLKTSSGPNIDAMVRRSSAFERNCCCQLDCQCGFRCIEDFMSDETPTYLPTYLLLRQRKPVLMLLPCCLTRHSRAGPCSFAGAFDAQVLLQRGAS